jgi:hypothetical protein
MFSKIVRRSHMYLALFLMPWMLMYALSTMAMNHRNFFKGFYNNQAPTFEKEQEQVYSRKFPAGTDAKVMADQILKDLHMEGTHGVNASRDGQRITIVRQEPVAPRRIIFTPADGKLLVERLVFRTPAFLERLHRRRGYQHNYVMEDSWASSVDLVIVAMVFWVASGLWMWWEMKATRRWGVLCAAAGLGLFGFFLVMI